MSDQNVSSRPHTLKPWLLEPSVTLYEGDARTVLRQLADECVDCCVTSPPYWGLRDYGRFGQLGLEATPEEYTAQMVLVFREVRRMLSREGTLWLNLGDTLVNKQLVGIPWRVAFALQADGWYLRSDIIWAKPNPMPESVTDRPTKAHEYVFLLSKQPRYFFDQEAVREQFELSTLERNQYMRDDMRTGVIGEFQRQTGAKTQKGPGTPKRFTAPVLTNEEIRELRSGGSGARGAGDARAMSAEETGRTDGFTKPPRNAMNPAGRNIRSVWEIATQPYPEAHFATFPEELARRCIAAGCPENGVVLDPFVGSGTVCFVARKLARRSIGIDLNESYLALAAKRLAQQSLLTEIPA